jgi:hypothetical protein
MSCLNIRSFDGNWNERYGHGFDELKKNHQSVVERGPLH